MQSRTNTVSAKPGRYLSCLAWACLLLFSASSSGQSDESNRALQRLTDERIMLTAELAQFQSTLSLLHTGDTPPEQSTNPAIRSLAVEAVELKTRLIAVTEQEVTLLQQQLIADKAREEKVQAEQVKAKELAANTETRPRDSFESKPLRTYNVDYTLEHEAANVERLHTLLEEYYAELQESARILPTAEEISNREIAQRDAESLARIPFSVDKVRLNGAEGSTALLHITQRLIDPRIPESRRDIAPICIIKTRLFDTLVGRESRSLKPVGKNNYIARVRLQPGDTTLAILSDRWDVRLPSHTNARDFVITFYRPVDGPPELHLFAIDDLMAQDQPHIPAWLPAELDLKTKAG